MKTQTFSFSFRLLLLSLLYYALTASYIGLSAPASASTSFFASEKQLVTISINKASAETIAETMTGIGLKKAQAIVEWRKKNGKFTSLDQLLEIQGIGEKTLAANKERIRL